MKKYIALSVNDNPDYLFHVPLTVWAWRRLGWEPIVFYRGGYGYQLLDHVLAHCMPITFDVLKPTEGYHSETITQVSRLYASCIADGYIMTGDIDMLPLSDYWKPDMEKLTVYGRDLTDYHYPICYIGAPAWIWSEIMVLTFDNYNELIKRDLDAMPQAKSADKVKRWVTDQDLITERINKSKFVPERIDRGIGKNGYPIGRIDRSAWTLEHKQFIDCHMFHGIQNDEMKFRKTLEMLHTVFPNEDFGWWTNYVIKFKKLMK